ncbi:tri-BON domain-containing protein [Flavobacterium noncentrifugens]|uniref:Osmotically-inducible protein OsmY, contains BON domain n=1 Tax=Flavobacterium noncentrifugens TaxID=1128970 RepID=A0A1G8WW38_9FLAO|nr:BON domain-containing protein [Flavobacterium noncentrifugens]GEP51068.1 tri-BON domain-containing protein [Flavobacterium noncentrifugens]SDJ82286.1 Osmotically-inducible protein OsmY, contains BON domain [Flavobacterium noncentrifugens]
MKTNEELQKDVQDAIKWEPLLHAAEIGVTAQDGIVTLSGDVDDYYKKTAAEDAAKRVKGVKGIIENIDITYEKSFKKSNRDIVLSAINALKESPVIPKDNIVVKLENAIITLEGQLPWHYQKQAATAAVIKLAGVVAVRNNILIKSDRDDGIEKIHLESALARNSIFGKDIKVSVYGSKITLTGKVASVFEKQEVERVAWCTPGVWAIVNELAVASPYCETTTKLSNSMNQPYKS